MSTVIGQKKTILSLSDADIAQGDATWYNVEGADKVLIFVTITGTMTISLDLDVHGDGTKVVALGNFTASDEKVLDDPTGRIRAYASGTGTRVGTVVIRDVYAIN